ncbi:MAG: [NiFe]-hydrogenase assembly chaperone HybE [Gammaproteobacteria bacterium]|nr:[NiFe]-hydrogenase assembly chaperone HybE [Gammaproteobacteria bacterium]NNJ83828.1 [NiFe]-hydrogenase assembly chaperone HybE [Gammaproteobacteria bacterium]
MNNNTQTWEIPLATLEDTAFVAAIEAAFADIYRTWFTQEDMMVNHDLPILVRALRRVEPWRVFLLLTPWMLARVYMPVQAPPVAIPAGWRATEQSNKPYTVIGPGIQVQVKKTTEKAHVNYHPAIGHYLVQPLIQSMEDFTSPNDAYEAWNNVIRIRTENIKKLNRRCHWQEDISRREFFHRPSRET